MNSVNSLQLSQNSSFMGIAIMWSDTILTCLPSSSPSLLKSQIPIHKLIMKSLSIQSYAFFSLSCGNTWSLWHKKKSTNDRLSCHNWISLHSITTQSHHKILRENQIIAWIHTEKNIEANSSVRQTEKERGSMTAFILSFYCIPHIRRKCALHIVQWKCRRHTNNEPRYGFKWLLFYWNATVNIANVNHF